MAAAGTGVVAMLTAAKVPLRRFSQSRGKARVAQRSGVVGRLGGGADICTTTELGPQGQDKPKAHRKRFT
jgi:hypothetical protein